jgi:hypothetical protein
MFPIAPHFYPIMLCQKFSLVSHLSRWATKEGVGWGGGLGYLRNLGLVFTLIKIIILIKIFIFINMKSLIFFTIYNDDIVVIGGVKLFIQIVILSKLQFGEGWEWRTLAPCLSKYTESQGMLLFNPTLHSH